MTCICGGALLEDGLLVTTTRLTPLPWSTTGFVEIRMVEARPGIAFIDFSNDAQVGYRSLALDECTVGAKV